MTFGKVADSNREEAQECVENYISVLFHNGQACGEYFTVFQKNILHAYINLQGMNALEEQYHCEYGKNWLNKVRDIFGCNPTWEVIDDDASQEQVHWRDAPYLYLFTHMNDWASPICRGDNGKPIPLYLLPGEHKNREDIYFWQREYRDCDSIWMGCGELEIPAYKQLATPTSMLASTGRENCEYIQQVTGIQTYYYLMRYWGRRSGEKHRKCPSCGGSWRQNESQDNLDAPFYTFDFKCDPCRLVSHISSANDDERHAVIGEWRNFPRKRK